MADDLLAGALGGRCHWELKFKKAGLIHEMTVSPKVNQDSDECDGNSGSVEKTYGTQLSLGEILRRTFLGGFFGGGGVCLIIW